MKKIFLIILVIPICISFAIDSFAQEEEAEEIKALAELTEAELAEEIAERLEYREEALAFIPELKREEDEEGNIFYTYKLESGIIKRLEELDKVTLNKIFNRVSGEINRLNNERLLRQLEQIRQIQQAVPKTPPRPPKVYTPPKTPPQPPTVPSPPPDPTRRYR